MQRLIDLGVMHTCGRLSVHDRKVIDRGGRGRGSLGQEEGMKSKRKTTFSFGGEMSKSRSTILIDIFLEVVKGFVA
jgi:hypothetical protein